MEKRACLTLISYFTLSNLTSILMGKLRNRYLRHFTQANFTILTYTIHLGETSQSQLIHFTQTDFNHSLTNFTIITYGKLHNYYFHTSLMQSSYYSHSSLTLNFTIMTENFTTITFTLHLRGKLQNHYCTYGKLHHLFNTHFSHGKLHDHYSYTSLRPTLKILTHLR